MNKKFYTFLFLLLGIYKWAYCQVETIDYPTLVAQIDQSERQFTAQNQLLAQQTVVLASSQSNKTAQINRVNLATSLHNTLIKSGEYVEYAQSIFLMTADLADVVFYMDQAVKLTKNNPELLPITAAAAVQFVTSATDIVTYGYLILFTTDEANEMTMPDRVRITKILIDKVRVFKNQTYGIWVQCKYYNRAKLINGLNPFKGFINQDKSLINKTVKDFKSF